MYKGLPLARSSIVTSRKNIHFLVRNHANSNDMCTKIAKQLLPVPFKVRSPAYSLSLIMSAPQHLHTFGFPITANLENRLWSIDSCRELGRQLPIEEWVKNFCLLIGIHNQNTFIHKRSHTLFGFSSLACGRGDSQLSWPQHA